MTDLATLSPVSFSMEDAQRAGNEWGFNCGPAALCAVLVMTPDELRPHMLDFESKGYTNPTLMADVLRSLGVKFRRKYECKVAVQQRPRDEDWPAFGLVRIQWAGPWTNPGVPIAARYRKTHWIAVRKGELSEWRDVFDVNAMAATGGWLPFDMWEESLVPWILEHCVPKASGEWWPTHCWEIPSC